MINHLYQCRRPINSILDSAGPALTPAPAHHPLPIRTLHLPLPPFQTVSFRSRAGSRWRLRL